MAARHSHCAGFAQQSRIQLSGSFTDPEGAQQPQTFKPHVCTDLQLMHRSSVLRFFSFLCFISHSNSPSLMMSFLKSKKILMNKSEKVKKICHSQTALSNHQVVTVRLQEKNYKKQLRGLTESGKLKSSLGIDPKDIKWIRGWQPWVQKTLVFYSVYTL